MWAGSNRVYLFTDSFQAAKVTESLAAPVYRLAESGGKLIFTNKQSN
jgi:hypothetical protein